MDLMGAVFSWAISESESSVNVTMRSRWMNRTFSGVLEGQTAGQSVERGRVAAREVLSASGGFFLYKWTVGFVFIALAVLGCATRGGSTDSFESNAPGDTPPGAEIPPLGSNPGGGSGSTPVRQPLDDALSNACRARFVSVQTDLSTDSDRMVPVSVGDEFIISSVQVQEEEVRLDLIYAWSVDEGNGDGGSTDENDGDEQGTIELNDGIVSDVSNSVSWYFEVFSMSAETIDALPVTFDCDVASAIQATGILSDFSLHSDADLADEICLIPSPALVSGEITLSVVDDGDTSSLRVYELTSDELEVACGFSGSMFLGVDALLVDGNPLFLPALLPVLARELSF